MQKSKAIPRITRRIGVVLFDRFSNHCLANAVEPLRVCNTLLGFPAFDWRFYTLDGAPAASSSGLPVTPDGALRSSASGDVLFVLPSYGFRKLATAATARSLRAAATRFEVIAGMDSGSWLLAAAGLLDKRRATIHWEELDGFAEAFPEVIVEKHRFARDGNRWTCAGATTAFDLVLSMIREDHGPLVALEVAAFLMHGPSGADNLGSDFVPVSADDQVRAAVSIMRDNLEEPLTLCDLSVRLGLPLHQLKAAFRDHLGESPGRIYRRLRLRAARRLAEQSAISVTEIAFRCGYGDPAAMTRAFRQEFGQTPQQMRRQSSHS